MSNFVDTRDIFGHHFPQSTVEEFKRRYPATFKLLDRYKYINLNYVDTEFAIRNSALYRRAYDACSEIHFELTLGEDYLKNGSHASTKSLRHERYRGRPRK